MSSPVTKLISVCWTPECMAYVDDTGNWVEGPHGDPSADESHGPCPRCYDRSLRQEGLGKYREGFWLRRTKGVTDDDH